jgi:hypothetical protein
VPLEHGNERGAFAGTPYMAPEQLAGQPARR